MSKIIEINGLVKSYGDFAAVKGVDLSVREGEIFGLLGPNGAGKTTVINCLCTLLNPTQGSASVCGFDVVKQEDHVRKKIGLVFQDPSLDDLLTGRENLELHARLYGENEHKAKNRIKEVLDLVELQEFADKPVRTYSGGMRRRLEMARGLIHYPRVLFLDEPTLGLDPQTREHLWKYIKQLSQKEKLTVLLTTHYLEEADALCDRVGIIDHGKIVALGTPGELKRQLKTVISLKIGKGKHEFVVKAGKSRFVKTIKTKGDSLLFEVVDGKSVLPKLLALADNTNAVVESVELHEPTLNDVFLKLTGHEIRAEEGEGAKLAMKAWMRR